MALFEKQKSPLAEDSVNMQLSKIPLHQTHVFSPFFTAYISRDASLQEFYHRYPEPPAFGEQIREKEFPEEKRHILADCLLEQYQHLSNTPARSQIDRLRDKNTFTVVTGHQLNICTGPLYFIYKIVTVINACKLLNERYPDQHFIPVYWMAAEDHDYEEIKSFRLNGQRYSWETKQAGAVGRYSTEGLPALMDTLPGDVALFKEAYAGNATLADAVRHYVDGLFGAHGLVVVDGDAKALKQLFTPVIKDDLTRHSAKRLVDATNERLAANGYKAQVHCRDINFFYLDEQLRSRIEKHGDRYVVLDTDLSFSADELLTLVDKHPERFSPNVVLRPLYQETILPNLAYCGGPAEMVYWLQLKDVFDHYKTPFPLLLPRNFALVIEAHTGRKLDKTGVSAADLFQEEDALFKQWVSEHAAKDLSIKSEAQALSAIYDALKKKAEQVDVTLGPFAGAIAKKSINHLGRLEEKMIRAEKRRHQEKLNQLSSLKAHLFPGGSPQERVENFMTFQQSDPRFIEKLLDNLDPFDFQFHVLRYPAST